MTLATNPLPPCNHRPPCPGCPRYGEPWTATPGLLQLQQLAADQQVTLETLVGDGHAYRYRSRLAIRGRVRSPKVGIFATGTHAIVDIPRCPVHHPTVNEVAKAVRAMIRAHGIDPYRERGHAGRLRYMQVAVERASGAAQVVLVDRGEDSAAVLAAMQTLPGALGDRLHSLFWNSQPSPGNTILGSRTEPVFGPPALCESLGDARVFFPPDAFGQANMPLFAQVVSRIQQWVPADQRIVEYYAGVGAIGLGLVSRSRRVTCNELSPGSLNGLAMGRQALPAAIRDRLHILPGAASACADASADADVVLVDPPRRGLDRELLQALCASPVPQLIYLSCGLPALLREVQDLLAAGYRLQHLCAIDLFPNTEHIETLVHFVH